MQYLFFIIVTTLAYIPYKGRTFEHVTWARVLFQIFVFILGSLLFISSLPSETPIRISFSTVSAFIAVIALWFSSPWIVRRLGMRPDTFIKENQFLFISKFEYRTMTMKLFEIFFQESWLLYIYFVLLSSFNGIEKLVVFFVLVVGVHAINIMLVPDRKWGIFFFLLSFPMGLVFGRLLESGLILVTTSIHIAIYLFPISYWLHRRKRIN